MKFVKIKDFNFVVYYESEDGLKGLGIKRSGKDILLLEYNFINNFCENPILIKRTHKDNLNLLKMDLTKRKKELSK